MKFKILFFLFFIAGKLSISAQTKIDTAAIKLQLETVLDRDQKTRTKQDSVDFMTFFDNTNLVYVENLISTYGWPGISFVGKRGNQTVFLIIQHAELAVQIKYFPLMQKSVQEGESSKSDLALLQDRILMRQGKKQIYGSQVVFNEKGEPEFYPIADEKNVNDRRTSVDLEPIEEYAQHFGIEYKQPSE